MLQCCILDLTDRAGQKDKALIHYYFANICLTSSSFSPLLFLLLFSLFIADHQLLHTKMSPLISLGYAPSVTMMLVLSSGLCTWQSTFTKLSVWCVALLANYSDWFSFTLIFHSLYYAT